MFYGGSKSGESQVSAYEPMRKACDELKKTAEQRIKELKTRNRMMSVSGDVRDLLQEMAEFDPPATEREMDIARALFPEGVHDEIDDEAKWYGAEAVAMYRKLFPSDD